MHQFRLQKYY